MATDSDLRWLLTHVPAEEAPALHQGRLDQIEALLRTLIDSDRLPSTIGLFGGWGSGKTTFLSVLAHKLSHPPWSQNCRVVYFNAWKYAGFMEIVPSLIYKVLHFGHHAEKEPKAIISEIMVSLGKEYSDRFGDWAEKRLGINPVEVFKDARKIADAVREGTQVVPHRVIDAYYTQVDRAQDQLEKIFSDRARVTVVLIDELDRCDPDEAFAVIKQLRIFFAMRSLPLLFVICANPEPIGLAIKHRYGLHTPTGDFEARRILEKFVDTYIDMTEPLRLDGLVAWLWRQQRRDVAAAAALITVDTRFVQADANADSIRNATALEAMQTDNPPYGNLRLLRKSLEHVCARPFSNRHLLWTAWHLELARQMDPVFRHEINLVASDLQEVMAQTHDRIFGTRIEWEGDRLWPAENRSGTLFGLYRGWYWEAFHGKVADLSKRGDAQAKERHRILNQWLADYRRMDFLLILSLMPGDAEAKRAVDRLPGKGDLSSVKPNLHHLTGQFGWLLANY